MNKTIAGVIGFPIHHSKSPLIHNQWLSHHGIKGVYDAFSVESVKLPDFHHLRGINITVPHKETILSMVDELDETARKIGAVNTVVFKNGHSKGYNTDAFGFIENLKSQGFLLKGHALIIGAGGAARAVVYGLKEQGMNITICNRTHKNAEVLAQDFTCDVIPWDDKDKNLQDYDLIVNTTTLGMVGQPELSLKLSRGNFCVTDLVYNPERTELLKEAKLKGIKTVGGLGMLVHQARKAFELWFGILPDAKMAFDVLRQTP